MLKIKRTVMVSLNGHPAMSIKVTLRTTKDTDRGQCFGPTDHLTKENGTKAFNMGWVK